MCENPSLSLRSITPTHDFILLPWLNMSKHLKGHLYSSEYK